MFKLCLCLLVLVGIHAAYGQKDCIYNGATHATGDRFASSDGCNTCFCNNGAVACTLKFCFPNTGISCKYGNSTYHDGASFKSTDGCNTCGCHNGMVLCTEMACLKPIVSPEN